MGLASSHSASSAALRVMGYIWRWVLSQSRETPDTVMCVSSATVRDKLDSRRLRGRAHRSALCTRPLGISH